MNIQGVNFNLTPATERKILKELGWIQRKGREIIQSASTYRGHAQSAHARVWTKTIDGHLNQLLPIIENEQPSVKVGKWLHGSYDGSVSIEPNLITAIAAAETYHLNWPTTAK